MTPSFLRPQWIGDVSIKARTKMENARHPPYCTSPRNRRVFYPSFWNPPNELVVLKSKHSQQKKGHGPRTLEKFPLPETKKSEFTPADRPGPKRKGSYSNHPFSGAKMLVSGRVAQQKTQSSKQINNFPSGKRNASVLSRCTWCSFLGVSSFPP